MSEKQINLNLAKDYEFTCSIFIKCIRLYFINFCGKGYLGICIACCYHLFLYIIFCYLQSSLFLTNKYNCVVCQEGGIYFGFIKKSETNISCFHSVTIICCTGLVMTTDLFHGFRRLPIVFLSSLSNCY